MEAYDIGFGGLLDHLLPSENSKYVMVFDAETYSNTGGRGF
ncbi:MAG: hypothetical protein ACLTAS_07355 [Butyribacter sp.]